MSTTHRIKCEAAYFDSVEDGSKPFEVRLNDRNYQVGDTLELVRSNNGAFGKDAPTLRRRVTYVLDKFKGLQPGFVVLGLGRTEAEISEVMRNLTDSILAATGYDSQQAEFDFPAVHTIESPAHV
jgi:hypothetical protein